MILDDWDLEPLNEQARHNLLEILEDRYAARRLEQVGRIDVLTGKSVGHRVIMFVDIDMIIAPGPAYAPFRKDVAFDGQRTQSWMVHLFKQLPSRAPDTTQNTGVVEIDEQFHDCRIAVGKVVKDAAA